MPGPRYPVLNRQPNSGVYGPPGSPDLRPSQAPSPVFQSKLDRMYGRTLAGMEVQDEGAEPGWAANELKLLAEVDDVQGNGVFDPPGAHPNIHPDAGVFAARYSLPGYDARERPFSLSEVHDVTTGRPIRVVPSGAVAMDSAAQIAFIEQGLYDPPQPIINDVTADDTPFLSTANVFQNPQPVGQGTTSNGYGKAVLVTAIAGIGIGAAWALLRKKKKKR